MIPVVSQRNSSMRPGDVYIGRPSPYGNPYMIGRDGTREEVIELYTLWITQRPELVAQLAAQKPTRLMCWCAPEACHGDVLAKLLEQAELNA